MYNLQGLTKGTIKKLKAKEANEMVIKILQAIVINDDLEVTDGESDQGNDLNETDPDSEHETDTEDGNN